MSLQRFCHIRCHCDIKVVTRKDNKQELGETMIGPIANSALV